MTVSESRLTRITDPADPRIEAYRDIRERDLVRRHGHFIAEGKTVLQVLVAQDRFPVHSLLVLENRVGGIADLIGAMPESVPVYCAAQDVMDAIAGFHIHRGILAIARIPDNIAIPPEPLPASWRTVLLLSGISNHDNMGGIFRNAAAFGVDAVLLDPQCCDPLYRKAVRVSVGGVLRVPFFRTASMQDAVERLGRNGVAVAALSPAGRIDIANWKPASRQALVLGSEGHGLAPEWLTRLETLSIGMAPGFDSLNVATAGAVALHQLRTARGD
ncbi:TrmH family RNA methyltransferase [Oricola thermophila]|uniref:RNA methyltransferase n=1 Tax=Oricola thermophila TaxID=2742145 RepID=A0A6N1V848_9HYPH|nr:RNA methyltransferase [Oricola thermophila]QKV17064.1 RNA methyltransferase [Oricola thermophila]